MLEIDFSNAYQQTGEIYVSKSIHGPLSLDDSITDILRKDIHTLSQNTPIVDIPEDHALPPRGDIFKKPVQIGPAATINELAIAS